MILKNKNAIITGCIQGIGKATLEEFAKNGANVWACAMEYNSDFESFCNKLSNENNVWIKPVYFNLLKHDEIKAAIKIISSEKCNVDILVNIAGMTKDAITHMVTIEQMKLIFEINLLYWSDQIFS